jgi:hypothetical protein
MKSEVVVLSEFILLGELFLVVAEGVSEVAIIFAVSCN